MKNYVLLLVVLLSVLKLNAQDTLDHKRKIRFPIWTTHSQNSDIIGISLAAFPKEVFKKDTTLARTYGLRIEASLVAFFSPLMPRSPVSTNDEIYIRKQNEAPTEIIYGLNLSSGTFGITKVHGVSGALFMQYLYKMNGVSFAVLANLVENHNGIACSVMGNDVYKSNGILIGLGNNASYFNGLQIGAMNDVQKKGIGIQIGILNKATKFKGIQLGLWNKNSKRSLPFINWNFK